MALCQWEVTSPGPSFRVSRTWGGNARFRPRGAVRGSGVPSVSPAAPQAHQALQEWTSFTSVPPPSPRPVLPSVVCTPGARRDSAEASREPPLLPCSPDTPCGDLAFPSCAAHPGLSETPGTLSGTVQDQPPGRCENVRHQAGPERLHPGPFVQHLGSTKARWFGCAVVGTVVFKQQDAHPLCTLRGLSEGECGLPAAPSSSPPVPHWLYKARQTLPSPGGQLLGTKHREKGKL